VSIPVPPFTVCSYCELPAATRHRILVRRRGSKRRVVAFIDACPMHRDLADREAAAHWAAVRR